MLCDLSVLPRFPNGFAQRHSKCPKRNLTGSKSGFYKFATTSEKASSVMCCEQTWPALMSNKDWIKKTTTSTNSLRGHRNSHPVPAFSFLRYLLNPDTENIVGKSFFALIAEIKHPHFTAYITAPSLCYYFCFRAYLRNVSFYFLRSARSSALVI